MVPGQCRYTRPVRRTERELSTSNPRRANPVENETSQPDPGRRNSSTGSWAPRSGRCSPRSSTRSCEFVSPPEIPESTPIRSRPGPQRSRALSGIQDRSVRSRAGHPGPVSETDVRAFAGTCTHLDCIVEFQKDKKRSGAIVTTVSTTCKGSGWPVHPQAARAFKVDLVYKGPAAQTIVVSRA